MKVHCKLLLTFLISSIIIISPSCKKEKITDERDLVIGKYIGIEIDNYWIGNGYKHDTLNISILMSKSNLDSIVDLTFNPSIGENFSFKYHNNIFICIDNFYIPQLRKSNDSLYFDWAPGLAPNWISCIVKKIN